MPSIDWLPYQKEAFNKAEESLRLYNCFLLVVKMRGRKTRTVLQIIRGMDVKNALIVCPPKVKEAWEKEMKVLPLSIPFSIASQDMFSRYTTKTVFDLVVIDEIHNFRSFEKDSKRVKSLRKVTNKAQYVIGMTGTLADSSNIESYNIMRLLGGKCPLYHKTKEGWKAEWGICINPMADFPKFKINPEKEGAFKKEMEKFSYIKDPDVAKEPNVSVLKYALTDEQKLICEELERRVGVEVKGNRLRNLKSISQVNQKKAQVCSGFIYTDEGTVQLETNKYNALKSIVSKYPDFKFIIWNLYIYEAEVLKALFGRNAAVYSSGKKSSEYRNFKYLICHPKSCGEGLDLSDRDISIYFTLPAEFIKYKQAAFRVASQEGEVKTNYILCGRGSIEEKRVASIFRKNKYYESLYT